MSALYPNRNAGLCGTTCGPSYDWLVRLLDEESNALAMRLRTALPSITCLRFDREATPLEQVAQRSFTDLVSKFLKVHRVTITITGSFGEGRNER